PSSFGSRRSIASTPPPVASSPPTRASPTSGGVFRPATLSPPSTASLQRPPSYTGSPSSPATSPTSEQPASLSSSRSTQRRRTVDPRDEGLFLRVRPIPSLLFSHSVTIFRERSTR